MPLSRICCPNGTVGTDLGVHPYRNVRMNPTERTPLSWILKNREKQEKQEKRFSNCYEIEHSTAKDWKTCQNFSKQNLFTVSRQSSAKKARLGALFIPRYMESRGGKAIFLHTHNGFVHVFSLYLMPFCSFVSTPKNKTATPNFFSALTF